MAHMPKLYALAELVDGKTESVRILGADRLHFETTARKHGWTEESHPVTVNIFLCWTALRRTRKITSTFEEFRDRQLVDFHITNEEPDADDADTPAPLTVDVSEDPTSASGHASSSPSH